MNFATATFTSPGGVDLLTLGVVGGIAKVDGTVNGGTSFIPLLLDTVNRLVVDTGNAGDTLTVDLTVGNPIPAGNVQYLGGVGFNNITIKGNTNYTLSNASLIAAAFGTIELSLVTDAKLEGGASTNQFEVSEWTGSGTLIGNGDKDTVKATKDQNFTLGDTSLISTDGMNFLLTSIENASPHRRRESEYVRCKWLDRYGDN